MQVSERYLIMVTLNNNNKFYRMIPDKSGNSFSVVYGRVGTSGTTANYPMNKWDSIYNSKVRKGYVDQTDLHTNVEIEEQDDDNFKDVTSASVRKLIDTLMNASKQLVKKQYSVSSNDVTPQMIEQAERLLIRLSNISVVWEFNQVLLELFHTIPRNMTSVLDYTARTKEDFEKIVNREYDLLQNMQLQVNKTTVLKKKSDGTKTENLSDLGLEIRECTDKEIEEIKSHLDLETQRLFINAWSVKNLEGEEKLKNYAEKHNITKFKFLYHGSRTENWWSIINTRLKLNPLNAVITGKMFGYGIYTAPKAYKSAGYTSFRTAYWNSCRDDSGYIAVYKVAYGNPLDVHQHTPEYSSLRKDSFEKKYPKCNCLHAHAGASLRNDEIILYDEDALTIRYLIKIGDK